MGQVLVGFSVPALVALVIVLGGMLWATAGWIVRSVDRTMHDFKIEMAKLRNEFREEVTELRREYATKQEVKLRIEAVHARIDPLDGSLPRRRWTDPDSPPDGSQAAS